MGKQNLLNLLNRTEEIKKLLVPRGGDFMPGVKTIYRSVDFQIWKAELKQQLLKLKQDPFISEILELLDSGFKNGLTDEKDFTSLQGKLGALSMHIDDYFDVPAKVKIVSDKIKKGTAIKTAFDEYKLIEQVGSGGNGRVFSATNGAGERVAIKFVERTIGSDKLKRFKNEISFCEHHRHKNIVAILDRGYAYLDEKDYVFYVMPLYSESLKKKIQAGIPHENILDIFIGLIEGLKYSHEQGSIHRDIKPENIMFAEGSLDPIICDFGIAHFAEEDLLTVVETKATDRMANFYYAAPEQYKKDAKVYPQTDIYSVALILNEMFTGEIPQAAGHKRIADVNAEYKYLDDLFDMLFKQDPSERLYPEDAILSELRVLAEYHKRNQEAERLKTVINEIVEPEEFNPKLINLEFVDNGLHFVFDSVLPAEWFQTLVYGSYDHGCLMSYDSDKLKKVNKNTISMPVRGNESKETITKIVKYVKDWVATVSRKYTLEAKRQAVAEQRRKEEARLSEIKRLEKENEMNITLNAVLKDLL